MIVRALGALIAALMVTAPSDTSPWGAKGHRTVAQVGSRHLEANAAAAVERILGRGELRLALAATWPDDVRSDTTWSDISDWHFLTVEDTASFAARIQRVASIDSIANVAQAIEFFSGLLRGEDGKLQQLVEFMEKRNATPYLGSAEATALALLVHFVGDIHQPLHVGRGPDRGGNLISVTWFGAPSNLHTVWDSGLIEQQDLSFTEISSFVDAVSPDQLSSWQADPLATWVQESKNMRAQVYMFARLPTLEYAYAFENTETVNRRLLQGGVRLAAVLNSIFP